MIKLDDRAGSRDLYTALLGVGLKVNMTRLPFGDIEFEGRGPEGMPVLIGIEHKQVSDVVKCIQDGRFAGHQLPGCLARFDQTYLMVEGETRRGKLGSLQLHIGNGRWANQGFSQRTVQYNEYVGWLNTMAVKGTVRLIHTRDQADSAAYINGLTRWWTGKDYEDHRAHLAFDLATDTLRTAILTGRPSLLRLVAKELPGIGWEKSIAISREFRSVVDMVAATREEWMGIDGIGAGLAEKIMRALGSWEMWSGGDR